MDLPRWRNRDSRPLCFREQDQVYRWQVWLHAQKICEMCQFWLPVEDFGGYGVQPCQECQEELDRAEQAHWHPQHVSRASTSVATR